MTLISNSGDAMLFGSQVEKGTKLDTHVKDLVLKSWFLDLDEKEVDNVNKGGQRVNKHIELWAKNAFDEWRPLCGFDITRSLIIDLSENESFVKNIVDMLSSFAL